MVRVIGLGTGRCGTMSLARLLDGCECMTVFHEVSPPMVWEFDKDMYEERKKFFEQNNIGEVGLYYLNYIDLLMDEISNLRVVCLKRDKEETVESYMKKTEGHDPFKGHFGDHIGKRGAWYGQTYPNYYNLSKKDSFRKFWDKYYTRSEELKEEYEAFEVFNMEKLNSRKGQDTIFEHCHIPQSYRRYNIVRYNTLPND